MKVTKVQICKNGSDRAVLLNTSIILTADPQASEDPAVVDTVARNLANFHNVPVVEIDHSPEENWSWADVLQDISDMILV